MQRWIVVLGFGMATVVGLAGVAHAVDECCVGGLCFSESGFPFDADDICPNGDLCGCTIDGTNCEVTLTEDASTASGDCLTLGAGVILDMNGHTISCTDDDCGVGIKNTSSGDGGAKVVIKNGKIEGCFDAGVWATGGTNSTVDGVDVDMNRDTCEAGGVLLSSNPTWNARVGFLALHGHITDSQVKRADVGMLQGPYDIIDSALRENGIGVLIESSALDLFSVMFLENDVHIQPFSGPLEADVTACAFVLAQTCNCADVDGDCQADLDDCVVFKGSDSTMVCDPSDDGTRDCSFH